MPKRKMHFDENMQQWLQCILADLPSEKRALLNTSERSKIRSSRAIKVFLNHASWEQIEVLLAKIGIQCSRIFYDNENFDISIIPEAYTQLRKSGNPINVIDKMIERKMFVTDSKDVARALALMSMNCHSREFQMNYELARVQKAARNLADVRMREADTNKQFVAHMEGFTLVAKVMLYSLGIDAYLAGKKELANQDLMVLLLLIQHPNNYVSVNYLKRMLNYRYSDAIIGRSCGYLAGDEMKYIDKLPGRVASYRITATGILVVGELVNYILNQQLQ